MTSSTFLRGYHSKLLLVSKFLSIRQTQEIIMNISGYTVIIKLIVRGPGGGGGAGVQGRFSLFYCF